MPQGRRELHIDSDGVPIVYAMCGLAFSGKSTVARRVAAALRLELIVLDRINEERGLDGSKGLTDRQYIQAHTEDYEKLRDHIRDYSPETMAPVCGIDAATLRHAARTYARAEKGIIFWGMGISQHTHGTDNARCLIALAMVTGHVGRPGTAAHRVERIHPHSEVIAADLVDQPSRALQGRIAGRHRAEFG